MIAEKLNIHYAVQTCDQKSWQGKRRICGDDRTLLSKKSVLSLLNSIYYCSAKNESVLHNVTIIDDHSSSELQNFLETIRKKYISENVIINLVHLTDRTGIRQSIQTCYEVLRDTGNNLVYQIQDDYIFNQRAVYDCVDMFYQMLNETGTHAVISPFNDSYLWLTHYRNRTTPRAVIVGSNDYWIQYYDMSCSFLTSHVQFNKHWDLYENFFELIDNYNINLEQTGKSMLENKSLNLMLTKRGVLGLVPIRSLAHHLQTEQDVDPFSDWKSIWDTTTIDI